VSSVKLVENKPYVRVTLRKNGEIIVEAFQAVELNKKRHNVKAVVRSRIESAPSLKTLIDSAVQLLDKKINFIREAEENRLNLIVE
jgi:hypothetical protein